MAASGTDLENPMPVAVEHGMVVVLFPVGKGLEVKR